MRMALGEGRRGVAVARRGEDKPFENMEFAVCLCVERRALSSRTG